VFNYNKSITVEQIFNQEEEKMSRNEYICDCDALHEELVMKALKDMPDKNVFNNLSRFYKILGDETRCRIIFLLQKSELCVCDIAKALSMTKSSVSHQLSKMRENGVVKFRKAGKEVFYSLNDNHVECIFSTTLEHINHI
jgi:ArsR family transcriptional regulator